MSQNQNTASSIQKQAKILRVFRKIHRLTGISLFVFLMLVSVTGLLLGWKKNSNDIILAKTYEGTAKDLAEWLPLHELSHNAQKIFRDSISTEIETEIDRIDVRKEKGTAKFTFKNSFWGIQLDGATGEVLHIEKRRSDFIEKLHDGSIVDYYLGFSDGVFKLIYTTILGSALMLFSITGFWLWYGPKRLRTIKKRA